MWLRGNNTLVSALGTAHLDLRLATPGLSFADRARQVFHKQSIFEPGEPQCVNACGFFATTSACADPQRDAETAAPN
jgi:hypothetical protein